MRTHQLATVIAGALDRIIRVVRTQPRPFIATISKSGVVRVIDS